MNTDILIAVLPVVPVTAVIVWALVRFENRRLVRELASRPGDSQPADFAALKAAVDKVAESESITGRIVTGIAETLIPTLRHLNEDVKDLSARVVELRRASDEGVDAGTVLVQRAEASEQQLAAALEELLALRAMAESVILEQSSRLKAIDIALDFLSSRVNELASQPKERPRPEAGPPREESFSRFTPLDRPPERPAPLLRAAPPANDSAPLADAEEDFSRGRPVDSIDDLEVIEARVEAAVEAAVSGTAEPEAAEKADEHEPV